ncbi:MAG: hypothetical protein L0206_10235 [Actinobacteria bacterium]|nr:hypothetical protein [Actinomycetota bacterium]
MYEWLPSEVELMTDTSEADWVVSALRPWDEDGVRVGSFMPDLFEAYTRLDQGEGDPVHGWSVRRDMLEEIASRMSRANSRSEPCWFCLWEGWGTWSAGAHSILRSVPGPRMKRKQRKELLEAVRVQRRIDEGREAELRLIPRVRGEHRSYFLVRGPLSSAISLWETAGHEPPNLWWPADRSWLVSTEIYATSTYVGGSRELIDALLASPELAAAETSVSALHT